jgi:hypothetical protein
MRRPSQALIDRLRRVFRPAELDLPPGWVTPEQAENIRAVALDVARRTGLTLPALDEHSEVIEA